MQTPSKTILFIACLLLGGIAVNAQQVNCDLPDLPEKDLKGQEQYTPKSQPVDQGWTELLLDKSIVTTSAKASAGTITRQLSAERLKMVSANKENEYSQLGWYRLNPGFDHAKGYTIEIKAKVTDAAAYGAFNVQGFDKSGNGFRIGLYDSAITESTNPLKKTNVIRSDLDNSDDYHVFRLAVAPNGLVHIYRDAEYLGACDVSPFYFDNIIANGGFEDQSTTSGENSDEPIVIADGWSVTGGDWTPYVETTKTGSYAALADNTENPGHPYYRSIPLKAAASYDVSFAYRRRGTAVDVNNNWRHIDIWTGTMNVMADKPSLSSNPIWDRCVVQSDNRDWVSYSRRLVSNNETPFLAFNLNAPDKNSATKRPSPTAFDDFYVYERIEWPLPGGGKNLFPNGDFEDFTGYVTGGGDNTPHSYHEFWGTEVRLQTTEKSNDTGVDFAHGGKASLRFSTLMNEGGPYNMDMNLALEPNKQYVFDFWFKTAQYADQGNFYVHNGDQYLWGGDFASASNSYWQHIVLPIKTTDTDHALRMFTQCTNWFNFYLDDIILYEGAYEEIVTPSFFFFGKSMGVESAEVEIASVSYDLSGAYAPKDAFVVYVPSADASLSGITIDGNALPEFRADNYQYTYRVAIDYEGYPEIKGIPNHRKASVSVSPMTAYPQTVQIVVVSEDEKNSLTYEIAVAKDGLSIEPTPSTVSLAVTDGVLRISGTAPGQLIQVYDLDGRRVASTQETMIPLPYRSIFLVRIGGETFRIMN